MAKKKSGKRRGAGRTGKKTGKRRGRRVGKRGVRPGEFVPHDSMMSGPKIAKRIAMKGSGAKVKIHGVNTLPGTDVWDIQNTLRKQNYFARAVGPRRIATNAPIKGV